MSIPELEKKQRELHELFSMTDAALHEGKISQLERDAFLKHSAGTSSEKEAMLAIHKQMARLRAEEHNSAHNTATLVASFFFVMISLFAALFYSTGGTSGITGAVVFDVPLYETYTESSSIPIVLNGTTRVSVSGTAQGLGNVIIYLEINGQAYNLYEYLHSGPITPHASLPSSRYEIGETVMFTAVNVSGAYLMTDTAAINLGNETSVDNLTPGNYSFNFIINDSGLSQENLPFSVVDSGTPSPSEAFDTCGGVCTVNLTGNATVHLNISNATLTLDKILLIVQSNRAPQLVVNIPDITATTAIIDLNAAFSDPDNDKLLFESTRHGNEIIEDGVLVINGTPGTYTYVVYASDLIELTPSNMFLVTIIEENIELTNQSANETPLQNTTPNVSLVPAVPNTSVNILPISGCNNPDPNKRPIECLQNESNKYFQDQTILFSNTDRTPVARITPIGNLLLPGTVYENDTFSAIPGDYVVSHEDAFGNSVVTIWFETATGDVHLNGNLHEENANLEPPSGMFVIRNKQGITLAWAEPNTGDLYVRGNVIPYRRNILE